MNPNLRFIDGEPYMRGFNTVHDRTIKYIKKSNEPQGGFIHVRWVH